MKKNMKNDKNNVCTDFVMEMLANGVSAETGSIFRNFVHGLAMRALAAVMDAEVNILCGAQYSRRNESEYVRAGSAPGYVLNEGRRVDLTRPRVRRKTAAGTVEKQLDTYVAAQDPAQLQEHIMEAFRVGVSSRDQRRLHGENAIGTSKSSVSRLWRQEGAKLLVEFRERDISSEDWLALMLDGVRLDGGLMAVIALGVTEDGTKVLLDFELGASETTETAKGLLERLNQRKFVPARGCRLLAVLDGSNALKNAVLAYWPDAVIQRCLIHKERNIKSYLAKRHWGEVASLFGRLRRAEGFTDGKEALQDIERFVGKRNSAALESLREAGDDLLSFHRLDVPSTLNTSFLSTNLIENAIRNMRRKMERVDRWQAQTDQPSRWLGYALVEAGRRFKKIRHAVDLKTLRLALAIEPAWPD
jgi:transposase-like protein